MNATGKTDTNIYGQSAGSMYILFAVSLVVILLIVSLLIFTIRLILLSHDIDHAFERCGADLLTSIRKENYDAVSESNSAAIDSRINNPSDNTIRERLLFDFICNLADSLECRFELSDLSITKYAASEGETQSKVVYRISDFIFSYTEDTGSIKALVEIPIVIFSSNIQTYSKELCYEFVISSKQV